MDVSFAGPVFEWRGPSPYFFVALPDESAADIREVASRASYGWGVIPVRATIGATSFTTSLFPKDGGYLLPLKTAVRTAEDITEGDEIRAELTVRLDR